MGELLTNQISRNEALLLLVLETQVFEDNETKM